MKPTSPGSPHETIPPGDAFGRLSQLPVIEPDATWAKRVQGLARAGVANARVARRAPARVTWSARLLAAALACGSLVYLRWAVEAAASLYR
jgi:hypothetical protein